MNTAGNAYRPEIDGLRAVAVLSVLAYHARNSLLPGGFVGVDIFFVISGFLITRNIWSELQSGHFSLGDFYLRRIRRIAPAFLLVTAATLVAGMLLLLPADLLRLGRSAAWASLSAANVYFWKYLDTSYFAAASDQEPLLHTWSLGVEEQFYLLWPALLMGCALARRARPAAIAAIVVICGGSFLLAEATNISAPGFSYYMLPTRAGELMMGALLALIGPQRIQAMSQGPHKQWIAELVAVSGVGLTAFSLWWLNDTSAFPGVNAIYPCLGATLLILSGLLDARVTRWLLTPRPVVFIGLISYSLYLWHWPIFAFIRYFNGEIGSLQAGIAIVAMLVLATASYKFVELPARRMRARPMLQVATLLAIPASLVLATSMVIVGSDGLKGAIENSPKSASASQRVEYQTAAASRDVFPCADSRGPLARAFSNPKCVLGAAEGVRPTVFVWGDSNAGHFLGALDAVAEEGRFAFRYAVLSTCPPLFGKGDFGSPAARRHCDAFREEVRRYLANAHYRTVVLAAQWSVHDRNSRLRPALESTIAELRQHGMRVVLVGQVPWFPAYNRECELRLARLGQGSCEDRAVRPDGHRFPVSGYMETLARKTPGVAFVDAHDTLCREGGCSPYVGGKPIYYNPTHLSAVGSYQLGKKLISGPGREAWLAAFSSAKQRSQVRTIAGYTPGFPYKLRSQRHGPVGRGQFQHVVIAEYLDTDAREVARDLDAGLSARGFDVEESVRGDEIRYVARRPPLNLTVVISTRPAVALNTPGAKGLVYFAWRDREAF